AWNVGGEGCSERRRARVRAGRRRSRKTRRRGKPRVVRSGELPERRREPNRRTAASDQQDTCVPDCDLKSRDETGGGMLCSGHAQTCPPEETPWHAVQPLL